MLGRKVMQSKIWYNFSLGNAVPVDDFYRRLEKAVDLSWVRERVADHYAQIGRPSIDPEVFAKIELIGYIEGITFDRQLMRLIADRLSLRRYIGYDLDEPVPDHSTLSKTRDLLGKGLRQDIFDESVRLCQGAGMVGGVHGSVDRSLVKADAAMSSLEPRMVELTPQEHMERVIAENPVEGRSPDNVVHLSERRGQLPEIGGAAGESEPEPVDGGAPGHSEVNNLASSARGDVDRGIVARGSAEAEAAVSVPADSATDGGDSGAPDYSVVIATEQTDFPAPTDNSGVDRDVVASEPIDIRVAISEPANNDDSDARPITEMDCSTVIAGDQTEGEANQPRQGDAGTIASGPAADVDMPLLASANGLAASDQSEPNAAAVESDPTGPGTAIAGKDKDKDKRPNNFTHVSRTDPDARIASKPGVLATLAYSAEFWTDSRHGVVTHADAFLATSPEHTTVIAGLLRQRREFGLFLPTISADKGYGKGRLYRSLNKLGAVGYIPFQRHGTKGRAEGFYVLADFKYDDSRDVYECPDGHLLHYSGISVHWPTVSHIWAARKQDCQGCAQRDKCTKSPGGRHLSISIYQAEYVEMAERVRGPGSRLAAIARRTGPEPRFGEAKRWTAMARAKYRGLDKVTGQVLMVAAAENLKKLVKWTFRRGHGLRIQPPQRQEAVNAVQGDKGTLLFAFSFCN